eukprot:2574311-Amphidinium_carterae.4
MKLQPLVSNLESGAPQCLALGIEICWECHPGFVLLYVEPSHGEVAECDDVCQGLILRVMMDWKTCLLLCELNCQVRMLQASVTSFGTAQRRRWCAVEPMVVGTHLGAGIVMGSSVMVGKAGMTSAFSTSDVAVDCLWSLLVTGTGTGEAAVDCLWLLLVTGTSEAAVDCLWLLLSSFSSSLSWFSSSRCCCGGCSCSVVTKAPLAVSTAKSWCPLGDSVSGIVMDPGGSCGLELLDGRMYAAVCAG